MIKIEQDKIIFDGLEKDIEDINVINISKNYLCFSSRIADCVKYDKDIDSFYQELTKAKLSGFALIENNIINLNNVISLHIDFYQYAGISIHQCSKENAELYHLNLVCKNGRKETIPFRTFKEAEKCYHGIDIALTDLRNKEASEKLLNS
ncbi:MAG: hypothetical protein IJ415_02240 [Clostridia bacterium]|nr:hypothetical protein [Clostridia bacterium]